MSLMPPAELTVVCPFCSQGEDLFVIDIEQRATRTRCPRCRRTFSLLTRFVGQARARVDRKGRRFYDFLTREAGDRDRMRTAQVSAGIQLRSGRWFTFMWRGDRLVGVADQADGLWFPVHLRPQTTEFERLWRALVWLCLGLAVIQLIRLGGFTRDVVSTEPLSLLVLALLSLLLLTPLVQWALSIAADIDDEELEDPFSDPFA